MKEAVNWKGISQVVSAKKETLRLDVAVAARDQIQTGEFPIVLEQDVHHANNILVESNRNNAF